MFEKMEPEEAAILQWKFHYYGDFYTALFEAIARADETNLYKLAQGFPVEVEGYKCFSRVPGWWQTVIKKARDIGYPVNVE